jgi:hypothetical protein
MIIREINQPTASAPCFVDFPVDFSLWIPKILVISSGFNCEEGLFVFEEISARYTSEGSRVSKERPPITLTTTKHQQNTNNTAYAANPLESNLKQTFRPPNWDRKKISRPTTKPKRRSRSFSFCGKPFSRLVFPRCLSSPISHHQPSYQAIIALNFHSISRYRHITSNHYLVPIIASQASNGI